MEEIRIMSLIEKHARITPDVPAIVDTERQSITYTQLNQTVIAITEFLSWRGIKSNQRIAAVIDSGLEMAIAYLAVSNIATFVPLGSDFSEEQYRYYFKFLKTDTVIIPQENDGSLQQIAKVMNINILYLKKVNTHDEICYELYGGQEQETNLSVELAKNDEIAVISYTSGTTAQPKIVPRSHINEYYYALQSVKYLSLTEKDHVLIITPMFRGVSLNMLLASLASGGCAVCVNDLTADNIFRLINETSITWFFASPSVFQTLVDYAENNNIRITDQIRFLNSGGAPLPDKLALRIKAVFNAPVFDAYGLTEVGWIGYTAFAPKGPKKGSLGVPTHVEIAIMDDNGQQQGSNSIGEIAVRGPQVIKGYDNGHKVNEESFFGDWFRTGDSGYLDDEGYLFITGRIKEIINRGGEKVSPYEIEAAIARHPDVLQVAVFPVPGTGGNEDVGAVVVLQEGSSLYLKDLRRFLNGKVVAYKMPTSLYVISGIPVSDAGKVQRNVLFNEINALGIKPQLESNSSEEITLPRNETEAKLNKIFKKILPVKQISVTDTFFELGGDSLRAAILYERIQKTFKLQIPLKYIFQNGSIENLADYIISNHNRRTLHPFLVPFQEDGTKTPIFFVHAAEGESVIYRHIANNFDHNRPFYGIDFNPAAGNWDHPITFEQIAEHYIRDIRSIQPEGPYILAGYCVGGIIACEMANQLHEAKQEISLLAIYDAILPGAEETESNNDKMQRNIKELNSDGIVKYISVKLFHYKNRFFKYLYRRSPEFSKFFLFRCIEKSHLIEYARSDYKIKKYNEKIVYFKPEGNKKTMSNVSLNIWSKLARDIHIIPLIGEHRSVFYEENAENTRSVLENILADIP